MTARAIKPMSRISVPCDVEMILSADPGDPENARRFTSALCEIIGRAERRAGPAATSAAVAALSFILSSAGYTIIAPGTVAEVAAALRPPAAAR